MKGLASTTEQVSARIPNISVPYRIRLAHAWKPCARMLTRAYAADACRHYALFGGGLRMRGVAIDQTVPISPDRNHAVLRLSPGQSLACMQRCRKHTFVAIGVI